MASLELEWKLPYEGIIGSRRRFERCSDREALSRLLAKRDRPDLLGRVVEPRSERSSSRLDLVVAEDVGHDRKRLGRALGSDEGFLEALEEKHPRDGVERTLEMLRAHRGPDYETRLRRALADIRRHDILRKLD